MGPHPTPRVTPHAPMDAERRGAVELQSAAFTSAQGIVLDAAPTELRIQAPGAREARVPCPFAMRLDTVRSKFSKKRGVLTVRVEEA